MYKLTLTASERRAMDWIGNRYAHGDDLINLLCLECESSPDTEWMGDSDDDITFMVPECIAWQVSDIGQESEFRWDCLAPSLASKLNTFCSAIV